MSGLCAQPVPRPDTGGESSEGAEDIAEGTLARRWDTASREALVKVTPSLQSLTDNEVATSLHSCAARPLTDWLARQILQTPSVGWAALSLTGRTVLTRARPLLVAALGSKTAGSDVRMLPFGSTYRSSHRGQPDSSDIRDGTLFLCAWLVGPKRMLPPWPGKAPRQQPVPARRRGLLCQPLPVHQLDRMSQNVIAGLGWRFPKQNFAAGSRDSER